MRPYRGLTKEGKWVFGWYVPVGEKTFIFGKDVISPEIFVSTKPPLSSVGVIEVIPKTIGQSTGLKDKNGKDLDWWEGDVFEIHGRKTLFRITEEGGCYWFRSDITKERFPCYQAIEWAKLPCKLGDSDTIFEDTTPGHKEAE